MRRGDIYYADLRPVVGSEQGGVRPVLVIQNDTGNRHSPTVIVEGLFTHFARADEADKTWADRQLARFLRFRDALEERGVHIPICHCANSAAIIDMPEGSLNLVRAGIALYGLYPSGEVKKERVALKAAMELKSHIVHVKEIPAGTQVSYGGLYTAPEPRRIATIPVGYGDGYPRSLSDRGCVLIAGKRAPIRGRACMDQFMVDVTEIPEARPGMEVTLFGTDGGEILSMDELAELSGRFNYEFACDISGRVPRIYLRHGEITETAEEIWTRNLQKHFSGLHITRQELTELEKLGSMLGCLDVEMQVSTLDYYLDQLKQSAEQAEQSAESRRKLYRYLGILSGAALAVLII